ncbi:MAG: tail fiber domain-containing protein, partial [candidate division Zixibacteria bacterium]|nr:tail fiber domain-containing protein [candidate division Zixibacteria bacterium]
TIGGGSSDTASAENACVPGGFGNKASGRHSLAAGRRAKAVNLGSFVWADSSVDADFTSTANNQFLIRAAGGVGVGTTAPEATLHVHKGSAGSVTADGNSTGVFENSTHNFLSILSPAGSDRGVLFGEPGSIADGGIVYTAASDRLDLRTNGNVTKMSITAGGSVGIGTGSPADILQVVGDVRVGIGTTGCVRDADGTVIAGTCSSDMRLKTKIEPFPNILDELVELQPVHFYWKADEYPEKHFGKSQSFGLIAQEVEKVMPDLVTEDEEGFLAVRYNKIPLLLLQGMKEQQKTIDVLQAEVGDLKELVEKLLSSERKGIIQPASLKIESEK